MPHEKNTPEIAKMRQVEPYLSIPPRVHSVFSGVEGLVDFIKTLRHLSCGKPIGIGSCIGDPSEFNDLCTEMKRQNTFPDFLSIDGGEGGTGAAPPEFSNSIGMGFEMD